MRTVQPVSPGEMLEEEFLKPLGLTKYRLAKDIGVPAQRIGEIVAGRVFAFSGLTIAPTNRQSLIIYRNETDRPRSERPHHLLRKPADGCHQFGVTNSLTSYPPTVLVCQCL